MARNGLFAGPAEGPAGRRHPEDGDQALLQKIFDKAVAFRGRQVEAHNGHDGLVAVTGPVHGDYVKPLLPEGGGEACVSAEQLDGFAANPRSLDGRHEGGRHEGGRPDRVVGTASSTEHRVPTLKNYIAMANGVRLTMTPQNFVVQLGQTCKKCRLPTDIISEFVNGMLPRAAALYSEGVVPLRARERTCVPAAADVDLVVA